MPTYPTDQRTLSRLSPSGWEGLLASVRDHRPPHPIVVVSTLPPSPRDQEIERRLRAGEKVRDMARDMGVSENTIYTVRKRVEPSLAHHPK